MWIDNGNCSKMTRIHCNEYNYELQQLFNNYNIYELQHRLTNYNIYELQRLCTNYNMYELELQRLEFIMKMSYQQPV